MGEPSNTRSIGSGGELLSGGEPHTGALVPWPEMPEGFGCIREIDRARVTLQAPQRRPGDRMSSRDRLVATLNREVPDRVAIHDVYWLETIDRWRSEGMPGEVYVEDYMQTEIRYVGHDASFMLPREIIEETDEHKILRDSNGVTQKLFTHGVGWTPHWLDWALKTPEDWERLKPRLAPSRGRLEKEVGQISDLLRQSEKFVAFLTVAPYEASWPKLGQVGIMTMMMDSPETVKDIFESHVDLSIGCYQIAVDEGCRFDGVWAWGDLAYRSGPLFSPQIFKELLFPAHKRLNDFFHGEGLPTILHSCGKIEPLLPYLIEAGWDAIQPLEAKVGQDVRKLKQEYGDQIVLFGNIDVRILSSTKEQIEEEVREKVTAAKQGGGYIYHSDHSVPPTVSLENYEFALECVLKYGRN